MTTTIPSITGLPSPPNRATDNALSFSVKADATMTALPIMVSEMNATAVAMNALATELQAIGQIALQYVFSTTTADADPGTGGLRLNSATQNAATVVRMDLLDALGANVQGYLDTFDDSSSTIKGLLKVMHATEPTTKWLLFTVSAVATPSGYRNITVACVGNSAANPFANGDPLVVAFFRSADAAGALTEAAIQAQTYVKGTTAGTGTAYTLTPSPAIAAYAAGQSFWVTFHTASGANPTLQISGLASPPSLVKQLPSGSYANIAANEIPANHQSKVTLLSTTQALVETLPRSIQAGTVVASTSGTVVDFTNIPAGVRRVTVMFNGVSTNGVAQPMIQLGDSGGIENTGYNARSTALSDAAAVAVESYTVGFGVWSKAAANVLHGAITLSLLDSATNTWVASGSLAFSNGNSMAYVAGSKSLSATLDRLRLTTFNGTDTFDAGTVNILYE